MLLLYIPTRVWFYGEFLCLFVQGVVTEDSLAVGMARLGQPSQMVRLQRSSLDIMESASPPHIFLCCRQRRSCSAVCGSYWRSTSGSRFTRWPSVPATET